MTVRSDDRPATGSVDVQVVNPASSDTLQLQGWKVNPLEPWEVASKLMHVDVQCMSLAAWEQGGGAAGFEATSGADARAPAERGRPLAKKRPRARAPSSAYGGEASYYSSDADAGAAFADGSYDVHPGHAPRTSAQRATDLQRARQRARAPPPPPSLDSQDSSFFDLLMRHAALISPAPTPYTLPPPPPPPPNLLGEVEEEVVRAARFDWCGVSTLILRFMRRVVLYSARYDS